MKKLVASILISILFNLLFVAQAENYNQTSTTPPADGKFEIITSPLTMRVTFLLNKHTGETWQLVENDVGNFRWNKLFRLDNEDDKIPSDYGKPVYQITLSGVAVRGTYLTNTLTGTTWKMYEDSILAELYWSPITLSE